MSDREVNKDNNYSGELFLISFCRELVFLEVNTKP
jgi:hypothetical protein